MKPKAASTDRTLTAAQAAEEASPMGAWTDETGEE